MSRDSHVVGIERNILKIEIAGCVRPGGPLKSAHRVVNRDRCARNHRARWIRYGSRDGWLSCPRFEPERLDPAAKKHSAQLESPEMPLRIS